MLRVETRISASNLQIGLIEGVGSLGSWVSVLGENDLHAQLSIKAREHKDSELVPPPSDYYCSHNRWIQRKDGHKSLASPFLIYDICENNNHDDRRVTNADKVTEIKSVT